MMHRRNREKLIYDLLIGSEKNMNRKLIILIAILFTTSYLATAKPVKGVIDTFDSLSKADQAVAESSYKSNAGPNCGCLDLPCQLARFSVNPKEADRLVAAAKVSLIADKFDENISIEMNEYLIAEQYVLTGGKDSNNCLVLIRKKDYPVNQKYLRELVDSESVKSSK